MKVNQISDILNEAIHELIGESAVTSERDLSNIVSVGESIINYMSESKDNFEKFTGAIIDKVGKTIFRDRKYNSKRLPSVYRDSWDYASVLEKIRCDMPILEPFSDNKEWDLNKYNPDVFSFTPAHVSAKYYNQKTTYQIKYSFAPKQTESAFRSGEGVVRFFAMIENRITMQLDMAVEYLVYMAIANFILSKADSANIHLLTLYNEQSGRNLTSENSLLDKEYLRFCSKTISTYKTFLEHPSMLYNNDGYTTFTPKEDLTAVFLTDFAQALKTTLYADTFNKEFVELDGYSEIPYWQASGTDNSIENRSSISAIPTGKTEPVTKKNIMAVLFDRDGVMVCNDKPELTSIYNPEARFFNYWHTMECSYFNDLSENGLVFLND